MQTNIPSNITSSEDINDMVSNIMEYLKANPYGAVDALIADQPCIVIAAVDNEEMKNVQPMFIIPSPELILTIVDTEKKAPIFGFVPNNLN